ncbi:hypothetical protein K5E_26040 [Enterococcus thailandicus]|uniref:Uncharacterized protein n=4 Tax=root TaxID=1 RepID=A0A1H1CJW5_9LACT|nr:hypothetical protein CUS89_01860 [Enterococcus mundtii]REC26847.1 hypothetical protein CF160_14525 [Enterococcus pseudoavium]RPA55186.1 hypothetical protein EF384_09630 [Aerococcus agrisoli]SDQ63885.1 hypothetical protein SAMN04487752_2749 [Carnobacterium viridans]GMC02480.1 hypothetical protein K2F_27420 [Enterococcus thailandicus]
MGFWYFLTLFIGIYLLIRSISAYRNNQDSKVTIFISILLILFSLFMFTPWSVQLIDLIFS